MLPRLTCLERPFVHRVVCIVFLAGAMVTGAQAQWAWRDAQGQMTFSDTPPPATVPANRIVRSPSAAESVAPSDDALAPPSDTVDKVPAAPPPVKAKSLSEQDADFRKRRDERLKAEQKANEEAARTAQRQDACAQARGYLDMINSGMRVMRANPDGTRGYLDDTQRSAEVTKAEESVAKNCDGN